MNDENFLRYLRISGYVPDGSKHKEIDVVVSPVSTIASDKTMDKRNNSSSEESSSTLLEHTGKHNSSKLRNKNMKGKTYSNILRKTIRQKENEKKSYQKPSGQDVKTKFWTKMTSPHTNNQTFSSIPRRKNAINLQEKKSQQKKLSTSSKTSANNLFSNRNAMSFPTTLSLHTSSANSSYHPSLSRTPPQRPINISNKLDISCYMDSVIQCLYWTPGFTTDFLNAQQKAENLIGETFRNIIASYNEGSTNAVEHYTFFLIDLLGGYFFTKTGESGQQDSQEFLTDLLSILTNMYYTDEYVSRSVVEEDPLPETVQEAIKGNESTETHSFIQDLFQSTVIKTSTCVYCNKESFKAEYQEIFTLEFGLNPPKKVFFEVLFNQFCNVDVGKNCFNTTECTEKTNTLRDFYYGQGTDKPDILQNDGYLLHRQQMKILKPAKNLIISFKRFETFADGIMSRKIDTTVAKIPAKMNLKNYMYDNNKKKNIIYDLYAFIHHSGAVGGGHYINYVKIKDQWWFVDDTQKALRVISATDFDSLRKYLAKSYILFYTKIE